MAIHYAGLRIELHPDVYEPAEDTFLLAENLDVREGEIVLDMGTGAGIIALLAARRARFVVGVDINPMAIELAWKNARLNGIKNAIFIRSDLFENVRGTFDLITFNPPYLPGEKVEEPIDLALVGGPRGDEVLRRFVARVDEYLSASGRVLVVVSSLTGEGIEGTTKLFEEHGFETEVIAKKRIFFEELAIIRATRAERV
ncbi:HemK2/MTQ2 family protein methyltransferase [Pyrococcus yayanosii]|uniref:Methylase, putative n=1 Tax=Pyrococcus yayanosii (strain CH1 / JCM 16557) TaxID=529709 RepID=F8AG68_PYRYC|nr:HemK2/MTQ2 family protein methyltransferase [Pyrococcus yayanosii]AEH23904.1 methylase, putative [Pyrococcus yayanosii CH1]